MTVPLGARGRVLGALALFSTDPARRYGSSDLALAEELARRAALSLDNARLYREAQDAVRARDEFLSIASHELLTPVTGLKSTAELMLRRHDRGDHDPARLAAAFQTILTASDRLADLTDDLLDVSRIRLGR